MEWSEWGPCMGYIGSGKEHRYRKDEASWNACPVDATLRRWQERYETEVYSKELVAVIGLYPREVAEHG